MECTRKSTWEFCEWDSKSPVSETARLGYFPWGYIKAWRGIITLDECESLKQLPYVTFLLYTNKH